MIKIAYSQGFKIIESICFIFPDVLIFFLHGTLENIWPRKQPNSCHSCNLTEAENLAFIENETISNALFALPE